MATYRQKQAPAAPLLPTNLRGYNLRKASASIRCSSSRQTGLLGNTFQRAANLFICKSPSAPMGDEGHIGCAAQQLLASAPAGPLHRATAGIHWMLQAHIVSNAIIC